MENPRDSKVISIRIPTEEEILENPRRADFVGGGWVDSRDTDVVNLYWHKRHERFTVYSLLQVLEHETLHAVIAKLSDLETSGKLDNIHRSVCVQWTENRLVFVNEIRIGEWSIPPYIEDPTEDLLG